MGRSSMDGTPHYEQIGWYERRVAELEAEVEVRKQNEAKLEQMVCDEANATCELCEEEIRQLKAELERLKWYEAAYHGNVHGPEPKITTSDRSGEE